MEVALELATWVEPAGVWRYILEKTYTVMNRPLRVILVDVQNEKRKSVQKMSILGKYLSNTEQNVGRNMDGKSYSDEV